MQVCQIYGYVISLIKRMYGSGLMAITGNELLTLTIQPPKQNVKYSVDTVGLAAALTTCREKN